MQEYDVAACVGCDDGSLNEYEYDPSSDVVGNGVGVSGRSSSPYEDNSEYENEEGKGMRKEGAAVGFSVNSMQEYDVAACVGCDDGSLNEYEYDPSSDVVGNGVGVSGRSSSPYEDNSEYENEEGKGMRKEGAAVGFSVNSMQEYDVAAFIGYGSFVGAGSCDGAGTGSPVGNGIETLVVGCDEAKPCEGCTVGASESIGFLKKN